MWSPTRVSDPALAQRSRWRPGRRPGPRRWSTATGAPSRLRQRLPQLGHLGHEGLARGRERRTPRAPRRSGCAARPGGPGWRETSPQAIQVCIWPVRSVATRSGSSPRADPRAELQAAPRTAAPRTAPAGSGGPASRTDGATAPATRLEADAAVHVAEAPGGTRGARRASAGAAATRREKVTTRRRSWPSCTSAGLTGRRLRAEEGGRQKPIDSVCRPGGYVGPEAQGEAIADGLARAPALDRVGAPHRRVIQVAPGARRAVQVEEDAPAGQIAGHLEVGGDVQLPAAGDAHHRRAAGPGLGRLRPGGVRPPGRGTGRRGCRASKPWKRTTLAELRRPGHLSAAAPSRRARSPPRSCARRSPGAARPAAAATAGDRASAFSWRQVRRHRRSGAPHRSRVSAGILARCRSRTRCSRAPSSRPGGGWRWPGRAARCWRWTGVSGSKLTSWKTGGRAAAPAPFTPAIRSTIERPRKLFSCGARARFTSVGAMSTCPTGSVTRRGAQPRHAHDQRHLGLRRVQIVAVGQDAVFAEALAVIAGDDDGGLVVQAQLLQGGDHPADVAVGEPDLAVVQIGLGVAEAGASGWRS